MTKTTQEQLKGVNLVLSVSQDSKTVMVEETSGNKWISIVESEMALKASDEMAMTFFAAIIIKGTMEQVKQYLDSKNIVYTYFDPADLLKSIQI